MSTCPVWPVYTALRNGGLLWEILAMEFVALWKAASIVVTGFFGMLALLTEFKNKETNKITAWGYISVIGILASTGFGTVAQLKENSEQEFLRQKVADQTLALLKNTDRAVSDIQRILTSIDEPILSVTIKMPCADVAEIFCKLPDRAQILGQRIAEKHRPKFDFSLGFCFMRGATVANRTPDDISVDCDLSLSANFSNTNGKNAFWLARDEDNLIIEIWGAKASINRSSGRIVSLRDIPGATVEVFGFKDHWTPLKFKMRTKSAQEISFEMAFRRIGDTTGYRAGVPADKS
jgi:hypothetical protein